MPFEITPPTSDSTGAYTYTSSDESVATISGSTITILRAGTSVITATQEATEFYVEGTITAEFQVNTYELLESESIIGFCNHILC